MEDYILYGKNPIIEALKNNIPINKVMLSTTLNKDERVNFILDRLREKNIPFNWCPPKNIDTLAPSVVHQGILAYRSPYEYCELEAIFNRAKTKSQPPFLVVLDGVEDPHNLGAIIRTAETAGVHGIVIPKHRACVITETVAKTSAGATEHMLIHRATNLTNTLELLKKNNVWIAGLEGSASQTYYQADLTGAIAVVLGSEGKGISNLVKKHCDFTLKIPMFGAIESLNVSASAAIIIYEIVKQKIAKNEL